jgi:hypothetical protein
LNRRFCTQERAAGFGGDCWLSAKTRWDSAEDFESTVNWLTTVVSGWAQEKTDNPGVQSVLYGLLLFYGRAGL